MNTIDAARDQDADHRFAAASVAKFISDAMAAVGLPAADAERAT